MSNTLIDLKKKRRLTNAEIGKALGMSPAKAAQLLHAKYSSVVDATRWQIRDLANVFVVSDEEIIDALDLSFRMSSEERSDDQTDFGLAMIKQLRLRL